MFGARAEYFNAKFVVWFHFPNFFRSKLWGVPIASGGGAVWFLVLFRRVLPSDIEVSPRPWISRVHLLFFGLDFLRDAKFRLTLQDFAFFIHFTGVINHVWFGWIEPKTDYSSIFRCSSTRYVYARFPPEKNLDQVDYSYPWSVYCYLFVIIGVIRRVFSH